MTSFSCRIRKEGERLKESENEVTLSSSRRQGGRGGFLMKSEVMGKESKVEKDKETEVGMPRWRN